MATLNCTAATISRNNIKEQYLAGVLPNRSPDMESSLHQELTREEDNLAGNEKASVVSDKTDSIYHLLFGDQLQRRKLLRAKASCQHAPHDESSTTLTTDALTESSCTIETNFLPGDEDIESCLLPLREEEEDDEEEKGEIDHLLSESSSRSGSNHKRNRDHSTAATATNASDLPCLPKPDSELGPILGPFSTNEHEKRRDRYGRQDHYRSQHGFQVIPCDFAHYSSNQEVSNQTVRLADSNKHTLTGPKRYGLRELPSTNLTSGAPKEDRDDFLTSPRQDQKLSVPLDLRWDDSVARQRSTLPPLSDQCSASTTSTLWWHLATKSVHFGTARVYEHGLVIGNHDVDCPLQLDWARSDHVFEYPAIYYGYQSYFANVLARKLTPNERRFRYAHLYDISLSEVQTIELRAIRRQIVELTSQLESVCNRLLSGSSGKVVRESDRRREPSLQSHDRPPKLPVRSLVESAPINMTRHML